MNDHQSVAIILAAGGARRMGQAKQLLEYREKTMLQWTVEKTLSMGIPVVVVLGAHFDQIQPTIKDYTIKIVRNRQWADGISSSINLGVESAMTLLPVLSGILIILADQPAVTGKHLQALRKEGEKFKRLVATEYRGTLGVPAYFPQNYLDNLMELTGDRGAKSLLNLTPDMVLRIPFEPAALDIDTKQDWRKFTNDMTSTNNSSN